MKAEFERFKLEKYGLIVIVLQFLGASGLLLGLKFNPLLIFSSFGLALLMFFGVIVRLRLKDGLKVSTPALFYMILNAVIFVAAIK